jgi:hypothetical protein
MRIAYALGEADAFTVLLQQAIWRREIFHAWFERTRTGPFLRHALLNAVPGGLFGLLLYPVWRSLVEGLFVPGGPVFVYLAAVVIAVLLGTTLQRWKAARPRLAGFYRWSARRRVRRFVERSALGEVRLAIEDDGLMRINAKGDLRIPWSDVVALLQSPQMLTVVLRGRRLVMAPRRAFADEAAALEFRREIERRSSREAILLPAEP